MAHLDDDTLALLALGERADERAAAHLAACDRCARELESLTATARVGREAMSADRLATPEPRVWAAVASELGIPVDPPASPVEERPERRAPGPRPARSRPSRFRRPLTVGIAALAAAAAIAVAVVVVLPRPASRAVETATLRAFPDWPDARGTAVLEVSGSGARTLHVSLSSVRVRSGDAIELWLIDPDASRLVSLGDVGGSGGDVTVPRGIDLSHYSTVDVSAEPPDGNPAHSGNSIVRGPLRTRS